MILFLFHRQGSLVSYFRFNVSCCSVTKLCTTLCDSMVWSTPGSLSSMSSEICLNSYQLSWWWYQMVFFLSLSVLPSLSMITSSCIHVVANSFLVLFHGWVISHCLYKPHLYSFHSSVDGHLGCVHVLAVANRAAMNIGLFVSFQAMFFFLWILAQEWDC